MMNTLLDPPFARDPAFRADAKLVGIVLAVLAGLGLLLSLIALPAILALGLVAPTLWLSVIASLVGQVLTLYGGWQMYKGNPDGKRFVIYGLIVYFVAAVLGLLSGDGGQILSIVVCAVVYYIVVTSRFHTEGTTGTPARET